MPGVRAFPSKPCHFHAWEAVAAFDRTATMYPTVELMRRLIGSTGIIPAPASLAQPGECMQTARGLPMEKGLCWGSLGIGALFLLLFLLDMFLGIPFGSLSVPVDVFGLLASGILCYLAWNTLRDFR
jgi:hypothetical protein